MKTFEVMFAKQVKVLGFQKEIPVLARQTIICDDTDKLNIGVPAGMAIVNIIEVLPTIDTRTNEKTSDKN